MTEIENKIKEKLLNEEAAWVSVDSGALWSGIQSDLAAPRRKKGLWIAGALAVLIASVAVWYAMNQPAQGDAYASKRYNTDTSLKLVETSSNTQMVVAAVDNNYEESPAALQENQVSAEAMNSSVQSGQSALMMAPQSEIASHVESEEPPAEEQHLSQVTNDGLSSETQVSDDQADVNSDHEKILPTPPVDTYEEALAEEDSADEPVNEPTQNASPTTGALLDADASSEDEIAEDASPFEVAQKESISEDKTIQPDVQPEELLSDELKSAAPDTSIVMTIEDPNKQEVVETPVVEGFAPVARKPFEGLEFGLYGGFNRTGISYTHGSNPNIESVKNQSEGGEWGSTFGLNVRKSLKNDWFIDLGVEKSISWTKFEYDNDYTVDALFENELVEIVIDGSTGDTTDLVYGTASGTIHHQRYFKNYTKVNMTTIPLMVGKVLDINSFRFGVSAGPLLNLVQSQEGFMINQDLEVETFGSDSDHAPLDGTTLGARISANVRFAYGADWSIQLSTSASQIQKKSFDELTTRFRWWTSSIGLFYHFR